MASRRASIAFVLVASLATLNARADIYRSDNGKLIPGTEGIEPGPGVQLDHRELPFAVLRHRDLTGANFASSILTFADMFGSNLANANFAAAKLTRTYLGYCNLTNANFAGATVNLTDVELVQRIHGTSFEDTTSRGFTKEMLYSTASYQAKNLQGISLGSNDLTGWDFSGQKLADAEFGLATLTNTNFSGAVITGVEFLFSRGFTKEQLYSTASYQAKNLQGISLWLNDLSGWDFGGQNLSGANFEQANLATANLGGANLQLANLDYANFSNANFAGAYLTSVGVFQSNFSNANLAGANLTNSFAAFCDFNNANLADAILVSGRLSDSNLTNANLARVKLSGGSLNRSNLTNVNLSGAVVAGASFFDTTRRGFTKEQLYATASYQEGDLSAIGLAENNLSGWNFAGKNLTNASFALSQLPDADFRQANLANADLGGASLTRASFREANLVEADFLFVDCGIFAPCIRLNATLDDADLTAADTRGASNLTLPTSAITTNLIRPNGHINGLELDSGGRLIVRDYDGGPQIPITVDQHFAMGTGGTLRMVFEADAWDSTISFAPGIPVTLGGTLELNFAADVNLASQIGRTFEIFNLTGVSPTGAFAISSPYAWDRSNLYTTGQVTLTAVPEPTSLALLLIAAVALSVAHRTRLCAGLLTRQRSIPPRLRELPWSGGGRSSLRLGTSRKISSVVLRMFRFLSLNGAGEPKSPTTHFVGTPLTDPSTRLWRSRPPRSLCARCEARLFIVAS